VNNDFDFSAYQQEPKDDLLKKIVDGAKKQKELVDNVAKAQTALKDAQKALLNQEQFVMPELMQKATLPRLESGNMQIEIKEAIRVNVSEERKTPAYQWLQENGEGRLIKATFIIEADSADEDEIEFIDQLLGENLIGFGFKRSHNAISMTSTIGKKMEAGVDVPQQTFGIFKQKFCQLKIDNKVVKAKKK
jgi:hypothetical protein